MKASRYSVALDAGIVAAPGPVSAEALTFTFVRPLEGPCTTTCVSTVSPRALDRLMDDAVPAVSVFPTLTRPDVAHTGNAEPDVVSNAMKVVRTTGTAAANSRLFARGKVPRVCSPLRLTDLLSTFMSVVAPSAVNFYGWGGLQYG